MARQVFVPSFGHLLLFIKKQILKQIIAHLKSLYMIFLHTEE